MNLSKFLSFLIATITYKIMFPLGKREISNQNRLIDWPVKLKIIRTCYLPIFNRNSKTVTTAVSFLFTSQVKKLLYYSAATARGRSASRSFFF